MGQQDFNQNEMDKIQEIQKKIWKMKIYPIEVKMKKNKIWKLE